MINSKTIQYPFSHADLITKIAYTGTYPLYIGHAAPGTATTATAWQIQKITYDANNNITDVQFASGSNDYGFAWDSRTGYSYS